MNRYKMRFSAMYPAPIESGPFDVSRIRSSTMMELVSYVDLMTQLNLKRVNRYFRKLVKISHSQVSLAANAGWVDAIHLSTFLKEITLVGEPKEPELKEFTNLLRNDGFLQLNHLCLHYIGEFALLEIIDALSARIERDIAMNVMSDSFNAKLLIQENEFSPYFALRFSKFFNSTLYRVITSLSLIVRQSDGLEEILKAIRFVDCPKLLQFDLTNDPISPKGYQYLLNSFWPMNEEHSARPLAYLHLRNTQLTDRTLIGIANAAQRGLLSNLSEIDLSENRLTFDAIHAFAKPLSEFLCPNIRAISLSHNKEAGCGSLAVWLRSLAEGVCPLLSVLELNECGLSLIELDALGHFIESSFADMLSILDIGNNPEITEGLPQFLQQLHRSTNRCLTVLNLEGLLLTREALGAFYLWIQEKSPALLQKLILRGNLIDGAGLCLLFRALQQSSITLLSLLDVSSNMMGSFGREWSELFSLPMRSPCLSIEEFDISHNPVSNEDVGILISFFQSYADMARFTCVNMEDMQLSTVGVDRFFISFASQASSHLCRLSIVSTPITGVGDSLYQWLTSPAACSIRRISFVNCSLSVEDLRFMTKAMLVSQYCQNLQCLRLSGNQCVDDDFVEVFLEMYGQLDVLPILYELDMSYTSITKAGANLFLEFFTEQEDYSLRLLNLSYLQIPDSRIDAIHDEFRRVFKGSCIMCYYV